MKLQSRRDTKPELAIRSSLHRMGLRFRVDQRVHPTVRGRADLVFRKERVAVYVDGCFWHGCPDHATSPKSNAAWWQEKLAANRLRDATATSKLQAAGWCVLRFWEHEEPGAAAKVISLAVAKARRRQQVLGLELSASDVRDDLAAGSNGALSSRLAAAAADGLDPHLIGSSRSPLPEPKSRSGSGANGGDGVRAGTGYGGKPAVEPALIGDLGEAFVHEWLSYMLEDGYGAEGWRSSARERYGLPDCGDDNLGYDFEVPDPGGRLFNQSADSILIEVKSTSTDGSGSFPMSRREWDVARRCHEARNGTLYVIVRVFRADTEPRIGDVLIDPFAAHLRGEIRLSERDLGSR